MSQARVGILMGSDSDFPVMEEALNVLESFGITAEVVGTSAHRCPARTSEYARSARERGLEVIIVGAGAAAHLGGVVAAETTLPVVAVPIDATSLRGVDALYATVMMPGGIPVACMAIGKAGAKNAGLFVVAMFASKDPELAKLLDEYRQKMAAAVEEKSLRLQRKLAERTV